MSKLLIQDNGIWAFEGLKMLPDLDIFREGNVENNIDKRPRGPIHNYLFNRADINMQAVFREGVTKWHPEETYVQFGFARYRNVLYVSLIADNKGQDPRTSGSWAPYGNPPGTPIPWVSEIAPPGFASMKGQAFDIKAAPLCAAIYGSKLPDLTGCALIGVRPGEQVFKFHAGEVKGHLHGVTIAVDTHGHRISNLRSNDSSANVYMKGPQDKNGYPDGSGDWSSSGAVNHSYWRGKNGGNMAGSGIHAHISNGQTESDTHGHVATCEVSGGEYNTTDHRKVNWIVRLC